MTSNSTPWGVLDGAGALWWAAVRHNALANATPGHMLEFLWSARIEIDHLVVQNSPLWNVRAEAGSDGDTAPA